MIRRRVLYEFDDDGTDQEAQRKAATVGATNGWSLQQMFACDQWREMSLDGEPVMVDIRPPSLQSEIKVPGSPWEVARSDGR
jgi:hypothetical protein